MSPVRAPDAIRQGLNTTIPDGNVPSASAFVATMDRKIMLVSSGAWASGTVVAAYARAIRGGTYSKIRFMTGTTAPSGLTDVRWGVWDATAAAKLAETANESATVTAATTIYTLNLTVALVLHEGQNVYLGGGFIGTTPPTTRGVAIASSPLSALPPVLAKQQAGWTTGVLPSSVGTTSGNLPWVELIP